MQVFMDDWDLRAFFHAPVITADGTFKFCPDSSYQLYNVGGYLHGEGVHLCHVLLPGKGMPLYVEMWQAIKRACENAHGSLPAKTILIDFETGAIPALRIVFPHFKIKGCLFHFRQALYRNIGKHGLQSIYQNDSLVGVKDWLRRIMAMALLPAGEILRTWHLFMKFPPFVADPIVQGQLGRYSTYVHDTWIASTIYPPDMWSHFDNFGPRTTNFEEGLHSKLDDVFARAHPSLATFLQWLQTHHCSNQLRLQQLLDVNRRPDPKIQQAKYRELNEKVFGAKMWLDASLRRLVWGPYGPVNLASYQLVVTQYLSHCAYLIGAP
jgi:hypothetical protein